MRLNHDCVRDILLYIEANTTNEIDFVSADKIVSALNSYDKGTILYHIKKIHEAKFIDSVSYNGIGNPIDVSCLSWEGHSYVANIRDNKVWSKIKTLTNGVASVSMPILVEYAKTVVMSFLPKP